jgi:hypothetical protein
MAFEPVFEMTKLDSLKRICVHQAVVEARLLSQGGIKIAKILSVATHCQVTPSEVFNGEARYNGRVGFKVIFADPEGKNHGMDYNADFTDKLLSDEIKTGLKPMLSATVLDTDIVSVDEREIKLACVAEVALDAVASESVNLLTKGGDNVYTHDDRMDYSKLVAENSVPFTVSDRLDDIKCENILLAETKVVTVNRRAALDAVVLEGNVICDLTCEDEGGMINSYRRVTPFVGEVSVPDAREGNMAIGTASLTSQSVTMEADGSNRSAALEYTLTGFAKVFTDDVAYPVTDAFSVTNELKSTGESLDVRKNKQNATFSDRVEGAVTLDINMPSADSVLAVTGAGLHLASAVAGDGRISYDGVVSANIIYYAAETNEKASVAVELPFSIHADCRDAVPSDAVTAKGAVTGVTTKIQRGNEIQIKADIEVEYILTGSETKYVITELALGEERVLPTAAFSVHIAKGGETLWDVAKALGMTPELVLTQNPGLALPLTGGERVIAYRHLKK